MDISETYIKMSNHPLIQGQHSPKQGDLYASTFMAILIELVIGCTPPRADGKDNRDLFKVDSWIWLPRQDDIQRMINGSWVIAFEPFSDWYFSRSYPQETYPNDVFMSMEQLWLAYYMHKKHGLAWDGDKWDK